MSYTPVGVCKRLNTTLTYLPERGLPTLQLMVVRWKEQAFYSHTPCRAHDTNGARTVMALQPHLSKVLNEA